MLESQTEIRQKNAEIKELEQNLILAPAADADPTAPSAEAFAK